MVGGAALRWRPTAKSLVLFQLVAVSISLFLITEVGAPPTIRYAFDIVNIVLACLALSRRLREPGAERLTGVDWAFLVFFVYTLCSWTLSVAFGGAHPLDAVWQYRLLFRFYIFYYSCIELVDASCIHSAFKALEVLFVINLFLVAFQYVVLHKQGDYLGGIFGIEQGANGYMNIYLLIMVSYEMVKYLHGRLHLGTLAFYFAGALGIAVLAELKFMYVELVVAIVTAMLMKRPTLRSFRFAMAALLAMVLGILALKAVLPESYAILFEGKGVDGYLSASWTNGWEIGRTTAIDMINERFFSNYGIYVQYHLGFGVEWLNRLFGFGFGSCTASVFNTPAFATAYESTNYGAFEFADRYLDSGAVGLGLYVSVFVMMFIAAVKGLTSFSGDRKMLCHLVAVLVPLVLMNIWYGSLRIEICYLLFFVLALPRAVGRRPGIPSEVTR